MSNVVRTGAINAWNTCQFLCPDCYQQTESRVRNYIMEEAHSWVRFYVECSCGGRGIVLRSYAALAAGAL
jgi:hypothetical protein